MKQNFVELEMKLDNLKIVVLNLNNPLSIMKLHRRLASIKRT